MVLLRILSPLRILFWIFIEISMMILILMLTLLVIQNTLLVLPWFPLRRIFRWLNVLIFWKSRMLFLILMVIVLLVLMALAVLFSIILVGRLLGQMFVQFFNSFLNKTEFFLGWIVMWSPPFLRLQVLISLKISDQLLLPT